MRLKNNWEVKNVFSNIEWMYSINTNTVIWKREL